MKKGLGSLLLSGGICLGLTGAGWAVMPEVTAAPRTLPAEVPFGDVSFGDRWYDGAQYGYRRGLIRGMTETRFGGELPATRAMATAMVWRLAGEPAPLGESTFIAVSPGWYYTDAVAWGEEAGLLLGFGDGTFRPEEKLTREQLERILERYWGGEAAVFQRAATPIPGEPGRGVTRGELAQALMEGCEERAEG